MSTEANSDEAQLICWLAKIVMDYHDFRHKAIAMPPEACKEFVTMHFPIVQGIGLQNKLRQLAQAPVEQEALQRALNHLYSAVTESR